ncbi:MAG: hypothetical protein HOO96_01210 [Polyangiaceae bacterium]|nr:hypothetical protein [Polyangiaceae bacterium]
MKRFALLLALAALSGACTADVQDVAGDDEAMVQEDPIVLATDTKIKNAIVKASTGVYYLSESDHPLVWIRSTQVATAPANAAFIHRAFNAVTNNDAMADKPLSQLKSETVSFEAFAARLKPVAGEDADNFAYHQQMTKVLDLVRTNLKNPIVIRLGRPQGNILVGAISVYFVGTLPSGKIGGLFTVAVET